MVDTPVATSSGQRESAADDHRTEPAPARGRKIAIVAGEHSGDLLGGKLMEELNTRVSGISYIGVGGEHMCAAGLQSLFPVSDVAVMGPLAILRQLPMLIRRVLYAAREVISAEPDLLIIIDSPEFTHPIAKRLRRARPDVAIIAYVSPTVWAWRPGRARKMTAYVDHILALLPFEPGVHAELGGPRCSYVGHPIVERVDEIRSPDGGAGLAARLDLTPNRPVLVVLPGSRKSEVKYLMPLFGEIIDQLVARMGPLEIILPVVESASTEVHAELQSWRHQPHIVATAPEKYAAFALADAALAASGTVTLELAIAGTPMVVAYKVDRFTARLHFLLETPSIVLANLVHGEKEFPEFVQDACDVATMVGAVMPLLADTPEREAQLQATKKVVRNLRLDGDRRPSQVAGEVVMDYLNRTRL